MTGKHQKTYRSTKTAALLFLLMLFPFLLQAQFGSPLRTADRLFANQQYSLALKKYYKAYNKMKGNREERNRVAERMADCYRLTENYRRAIPLYEHLVRYGWAKKHPLVYLRLADLMKMYDRYTDAEKYYKEYIQAVPDDPRGKLGLSSLLLVKDWTEHPTNYQVTHPRKLNSREADYAPAFLSENFNSIVFTSTRKESTGKELDGWTGQKFSDLFTDQQDREGKWSNPVLLDSKTGNVNTNANEGDPWVNDRYNRMYFTRCKKVPDKKTGCQIYVSQRVGRIWSKAKRVRIMGVDTTASVGQPTLSKDELTMIFASDKRGSLGGTDLWISKRKDVNAPFGHPFNLGPVINTKGNEMFPFLRNDSILYFSSDGHGGMGGLDIFVSRINASGTWSQPENLKYPVNSPFDDLSFIIEPNHNRGYFSSNRKGSVGKEDLYAFVIPEKEFSLSGTVTNARTLFGMGNLRIDLTDSLGSRVSTITNDKGYYSFGQSQVRKNRSYTLSVSEKNYLTQTHTFTTKGLDASKDFTVNFRMEPIPSKPVVLPDILYDLGKWNLKTQYQDSLQGLVQMLRDNPGLVIELGSHTDSRGSDEENDILSQRRARSVVNYLILRGINPGRLVAKGYGERVPRTLQKNITRNGYPFKEGTTLTDPYIQSLPDRTDKEAAYALNRRTDFRILRRDFKPNAAEAALDTNFQITLTHGDNEVPFYASKSNGLYVSSCLINGLQEPFMYDPNNSALISVNKAIELLNEGIISKEDFVGNPEEILQNNTIRNNAVLNLKEVTIGGKTIKNLQVIVSKNLFFGIVFGKPVLNQLGKYDFNTQKHLLIIHGK
ncbi:MAG: OmpA family protein [Bacteroidales bacterium]|nr:OmpA family protein [Bacteroidales bacterium]